MKKYLMTGIAALALCAGFTACSSTDDYSFNEEEYAQLQIGQMQAQYEQAFVKVFGKAKKNHDWGFSDNTTRSGNTGETYAQTHGDANGGANMNCNEWADPDKEFGGWVVPDALTDEQKAVVTAYFQSHPNIDYVDPQFRHFFVQQVYKGGDAQAGPSTENITAADGSVYNSDNMNQLTVGEANIHINNFNAGTCTKRDVLDNGQKVGGTSHKDQITLMVNIDDTSCFGYHDTGSSNVSSASPNHNDKMALVGWKTIDTWAKTNYTGYKGCLDDGWNRSFMGFDLAIKEGAQAYATDNNGNVLYATYDQAPESPRYAWDGEKIIDMAASVERVYPDPTNQYWYNEIIVLKDEHKSIFGCGWLTTNENFYVAADKVKLNQQKVSANRAQYSELNAANFQDCPVIGDVMDGNTYYQSVINLPRIKQLVDAGYLPVKDKSLQEWVKVGTSDGYFTDWIVTLTEAQRIGRKADLRVMAEDLSADDASDFDFNDVVFDVFFSPNQGEAYIEVLAAGGTLPLTINGTEVHNLFEVDQDYMVNTHAEAKNLKGGSGLGKKKIVLTDITVNSKTDANQKIHIKVTKPIKNAAGELVPTEIELVNSNAAACKIGVDPSYNWADERTCINDIYQFNKWVTEGGQLEPTNP